MRSLTAAVTVALMVASIKVSEGISLYEYYAPGGVITSGINADSSVFTLNGIELTIYSGSFHYFRVHPNYWRETLTKFRAAGLNTVQTYVPWNLHEPRQGEFDFGSLGEDMSLFLNLRSFVQMAQEEDLFVTLRPGPYICAEWEFGGFPSWLLRDPTMHVRSYYENYRVAASTYLNRVLTELSGMQFVDGGPIIAMQIENEFGAFAYGDEPRDHLYMEYLRETILSSGYTSTLLFTSDNPLHYYDRGSIPGVLQTANLNSNPEGKLDMLEYLQPGKPKMVTEFWTGWYDYWLSEKHSTWLVDDFAAMYEWIVSQGASINLYMMIGGTNFGFLAGANEGADYIALVTSYDYDAPLTEAGDYTEKYWRIQEIMSRLNPIYNLIDHPTTPVQRSKGDYGVIAVTESMDLWTMAAQAPQTVTVTNGPIAMEELPINNNNGQSYGYALYTSTVYVAGPQSTLQIRYHVRDMAQVILDGEMITQQYNGDTVNTDAFGFWGASDSNVTITSDGSDKRLDILVENLGRTNAAAPHTYNLQKKGLWEGNVTVNREIIYDWTITPLEFKQSFVQGLTGWSTYSGSLAQPGMYRATFTIEGDPLDTFLHMGAWGKGVVFMNGFNLGRYWSEGPQITLYVPAPVMYTGLNEVVVFEQYAAAAQLTFTTTPVLGP